MSTRVTTETERIGAWDLRASTAEAVALLWRSAPGSVTGFLLLTLASAGAPIATAWSTKLVIDRLAAPRGGVGWPALVLVAGGLCTAALPVTVRYLRAQLGRSASVVATERLFAAAENQVGLRRFEDPAFLDRLRLAQEGTGRIPELVDGIGGALGGALSLAGFLGSLLILSPAMTALVVLAALPALAAELFLSRRRSAMEWSIEHYHRREYFYGQLLTGVAAAMEIRLFGIGAFLRGRMVDERRAAGAAGRRMDLRELRTQGGLTVLSAAVAGAGLWWAITTARQGALSVGDVSMFLAAVIGVQAASATLTGAISGGYGRLLAFTHYIAVVRAEPDLPRARHGGAAPLGQGIEFRDVWFRYGDDHSWVLRGVNLTIPRGHAVALVGLNGVGKSTLVKLLCRMYDPTRGRILWDGVDVRDIPPDSLRERISAVFQDPMNYDMTATENIGLGDLTALSSPDRVAEASRRAGIHDTLAALPSRVRHAPHPHLHDRHWGRPGDRGHPVRRPVAATRAGPRLRTGGPGPDDPRRAELRPGPRRRSRDPYAHARTPRGPYQPADLPPPQRRTRRRPHRRPGRRPDHRTRVPRRAARSRGRLREALPPPGRRLPGGTVIAGLGAATVLLAVVCLGCLVWGRRRYLVTTVDGTSMEPGLRPGDRVLVRRTTRAGVGQVVVLTSPASRARERRWPGAGSSSSGPWPYRATASPPRGSTPISEGWPERSCPPGTWSC